MATHPERVLDRDWEQGQTRGARGLKGGGQNMLTHASNDADTRSVGSMQKVRVFRRVRQGGLLTDALRRTRWTSISGSARVPDVSDTRSKQRTRRSTLADAHDPVCPLLPVCSSLPWGISDKPQARTTTSQIWTTPGMIRTAAPSKRCRPRPQLGCHCHRDPVSLSS